MHCTSFLFVSNQRSSETICHTLPFISKQPPSPITCPAPVCVSKHLPFPLSGVAIYPSPSWLLAVPLWKTNKTSNK